MASCSISIREARKLVLAILRQTTRGQKNTTFAVLTLVCGGVEGGSEVGGTLLLVFRNLTFSQMSRGGVREQGRARLGQEEPYSNDVLRQGWATFL